MKQHLESASLAEESESEKVETSKTRRKQDTIEDTARDQTLLHISLPISFWRQFQYSSEWPINPGTILAIAHSFIHSFPYDLFPMT